jgi:hypothetical protein
MIWWYAEWIMVFWPSGRSYLSLIVVISPITNSITRGGWSRGICSRMRLLWLVKWECIMFLYLNMCMMISSHYMWMQDFFFFGWCDFRFWKSFLNLYREFYCRPSELSKRRIRSMNKLVRVGGTEIVTAIRVDREKGAHNDQNRLN